MTHAMNSLTKMKAFAEEVAGEVRSLPRALLLLNGPMGAGKTQFTRFLLAALGSDETCSPSFAIHHNYISARGAIDHFDLFRLESAEDLESTGFWDLFLKREGFVVIEWAERLAEFGLESQLPRTWPTLEFRFDLNADLGPEGRTVSRRSSGVRAP